MPARLFEETVLPHLDAAFNYARWLTRNDAEVQDAYVRALRFLGPSCRGSPAVGNGCWRSWAQCWSWRGTVTCHDVGRLLDAYVDHELDPAESASFQEHLA